MDDEDIVTKDDLLKMTAGGTEEHFLDAQKRFMGWDPAKENLITTDRTDGIDWRKWSNFKEATYLDMQLFLDAFLKENFSEECVDDLQEKLLFEHHYEELKKLINKKTLQRSTDKVD